MTELDGLPLMAFAFLIGSIFGSFANVVIVRVPSGESVVRPGSHCRSCGTAVLWHQNIPILSWFLLRGRCAKCASPFSIRYPLVEALVGAIFAGIAWRHGVSWRSLELAIFATMLVCASGIDVDRMILPDKFTITGIAMGLVGAAIVPDAGRTLLESGFGILLGGGFLWAVAALYLWARKRDGMGGGDIKLLAWIGAALGWKAIPAVILLSSLVGSVAGMALAWRAKDGMQKAIPFGPYLAASALAYEIFGGRQWADWYLRLHGFDP